MEIVTADSTAKKNPEGISESDAELVKLAREQLADAQSFYSEIRKNGREDAEFSIGEQWEQSDKIQRAAEGRPIIVVNKVGPALRQVTNDARQNRQAIKVSPVDDRGDVETAKVYSGMIRHIERQSNAGVAYDAAIDGSARRGYGFIRVIAAYADHLAFRQELRIKRVRDPDSCIIDPNSVELDGSDAEHGWAIDKMSRAQFKRRWPNAKLCAENSWAALEQQTGGWVTDASVQVADYYFREWKDDELIQFNNGETVLLSLMEKYLKSLPPGAPFPEPVAKRPTQVPIVHHVQLNGFEILERTIWPGRFIPIVPTYGEEVDIQGKLHLRSLVRSARDPQRMYNFWKSNEAEVISLAPKAPFIGAEGQFEGHPEWKTANRRNHPFLEYKPITIGGVLAPPPQRNGYEPPIQAITQASMLASDDLKSTTGIYDSALGAKSNEQSGIAIQRRNVQAQTANFHFIDNATTSIRHVGRILVEAIPIVYDIPQSIRIINDDNEEEIIRIHEETKRNGKSVFYRLDHGKYDVDISTGPSFETKRQEAASLITELTRGNPKLMDLAGDLLVRNLDFHGAREIADRLKKALPPGIADEKGGDIPPQVAAQLQQYGQLIDTLTAQNNEMSKAIENKRMELESKERIEMAKIQSNIEIENARLDSANATEILRQEISQLEQRMALLRFNEPVQPGGARNGAPAETQQQNQTAGSQGAFGGQNLTGEESPGTYVGETP